MERRSGCASCRYFNGEPVDIEAALPGLSSLSSAYAAVRSDDGLCSMHDRYVAANSVCGEHTVRRHGVTGLAHPAAVVTSQVR
jgi:hypothetical protein